MLDVNEELPALDVSPHKLVLYPVLVPVGCVVRLVVYPVGISVVVDDGVYGEALLADILVNKPMLRKRSVSIRDKENE